MITTIRDIASMAHVSTATVSRVLNNRANVSEMTRSTVLQAAQELNYPLARLRSPVQLEPKAPTAGQKVLVLTRQDIGQIGPNTTSREGEFEYVVADGLQLVFTRLGLVAQAQRTPTLDEAEAYADDADLAGLVLLGGIVDRLFAQRLQELGVPFVVVGAHLRPLEVNCVMADVGHGIRKAVEHVANSGRQRIGLVNGPSTTMTSSEKLDALRMALHIEELSFAPTQVVASDFYADASYAQTRQLFDQRPDLDAVIYADDTMALGGLRALKEMGRRIPHDVAVVGFGDYDVARYTDPLLTTVRFDRQAMGVIAARRLHMMIQTPEDRQAWFTVVPTNLVVRDST